MKKTTIALLASTTALAACGGGGGGPGGGDLPTVSGFDGPPINSMSNPGDLFGSGSGSTEGFIAAVKKLSDGDKTTAKELYDMFAWTDANAHLVDRSVLEEYEIEVDGIEMKLSKAWDMLLGFKKVYYDGKEGFWHQLSLNGEYDNESEEFQEIELASNRDSGKSQQELIDFYADKGNHVVPEEVESQHGIENENPVEEDEPVEQEQEVQEPEEEQEVQEPETPEQPPVNDSVEPPAEETPEETPVEEENEEVTPPEETTPPVEEEEVVEEANTPDEPVEEQPEEEEAEVTVVDSTSTTGALYYSHLEREYLEPEASFVTESRLESGVLNTYKVVTTCTPENHTHYDAQDTTTVITYTDGTTETTVSTEYYPRATVKKPGNCGIEEILIATESTDDEEIGEVHADMGTRTPGYVADRTHYQTAEFTHLTNYQLEVSKFDVAYSRGWTGKGSLVTIADTGADIDHSDLDDNIAYTIDYTGNGISNNAEHGSHVTGIAVAEKNGSGMHGAAFDANAAVAKVGSGYNFSFFYAKQAAAWGRDKGSVAINISAAVNLDNAMRNSIIKDSEGVYHSDHWYYGENGYNGAVNEAVDWKTALGNEQVLVKAAGNHGYDYSSGMNQMATATDSDGNLILDGQMLIVGNYDTANGKLAGSSNKAGTVCATYTNGVCIDAAKIKDFYIMADGTGITSTDDNGGYVTMSGTSMAAPVVTGSIAVLHQMWPHMKGKHLVQLVLVTANKTVAGYDENVHGQGLLDMDRATRPVGATGIPTTGRTNGGVSSVSGFVATAGGANVQALTGVMVLDSFERDFYIDLGDMNATIDTRTASVAEQMGAIDYYAGYMNSNQHMNASFGNWDLGFGKEDSAFLGNQMNGTLGTVKESHTAYATYNYTNGGFYAQAGGGITKLEMDTTNSLLDSAEPVISSTWTLGYEKNGLGVSLSQPVTIESAKMNYNVPSARTLDGRVVHELRTVDWKAQDREIDLGTYYNFSVMQNTVDVKLFGELRTGVAAIQKEVEKRAGVSVNFKF